MLFRSDNTTTVSAGSAVSFWFTGPVVTATSANNSIQIDTFGTSPNTSAQYYGNTTINGTAVVVALESAVLGRTQLDAGVWNFNLYANANSSGGTTTIGCSVYEVVAYSGGTVTITGSGTSRTATSSNDSPFANVTAGSDVTSSSYLQTPQGLYLITGKTSSTVVTITTPSGYVNESAITASIWNPKFSSGTTTITSTTVSGYAVSTSQPAYSISVTSALGVLVFTTTTQNKIVYVAINGTTSSYVNTPLHTLHDDLAGLQGGQSSEYYHLTNAEYTGTGTGNFVRATTPTLTTPIIGAATGTSLSVSGNILAGNVYANSGTIGASLLTGTLTTATQPNITSLGILSSLSVSGNANVGNIGATLHVGNLSGTGNSNVGNLGATGIYATTLSATGNANVGNIGATAFVTSSTTINSGITTTGNANVGNLGTTGVFATTLSATGNANVGNIGATLHVGNLSGTGNSNVGNIGGTGAYFATLSATGNANVGNIGATAFVTPATTINSGITTTGNANVGNLGTAGVFATTLSATGNANTANLGTGLITASGNITGANLVTGGVLSVTGNANVGNIGATLFVGNLSGTGNSNVGNLGATGVFATTLSARSEEHTSELQSH